MLLTLREAARRLGICEQVARREIGHLSVLVGNRRMYNVEVIERFAERGSVPKPVTPRPVVDEALMR